MIRHLITDKNSGIQSFCCEYRCFSFEVRATRYRRAKFSSLEQEMEYRNWNVEKDGPLETRLMFRDMILLKRPSIRK